MSHYWSEWTTTDFKTGNSSYIAVLPLSAIEQHGPHLPLGTDQFISEGLVSRTVEKLSKKDKIVILPTQNIGVSPEHQSFKGTLSIDWDTAGRSWLNIGESIHRAGIKKLIMISSHGGNMEIINLVARRLRLEYKMQVVCTHWQKLLKQSSSIDIHAGQFETSLMLAMRPDLVRKSEIKNFDSSQTKLQKSNNLLGYHSSPANLSWLSEDLNKHGAMGDAKSASKQEGEKLIKNMVSGFLELLKEFSRMK